MSDSQQAEFFLVTAGVTHSRHAVGSPADARCSLRLLFVIFYQHALSPPHRRLSTMFLNPAERCLSRNHMSFIDGFLLMASVDRPIRFVVDAAYATHPLFKWLMTAMKVIPIASGGGPRIILRALRSAGQALDDGEIVCIFPEGQITRTGTRCCRFAAASNGL